MFQFAVFALAAFITSSAFATTWNVDSGHSNVIFTVRHLVSKVSGTFNDFSGSVVLDSDKPENSIVKFEVRTESIFTSLKVRDEHLRSSAFFDSNRFKTANFTSKRIAAAGKGLFKVEGMLEIRGIEKPVALEVEYLGTSKDQAGANRSGFTARTQLKRSDFGLTWNQITEAGLPVLGDEVEMQFNISLVELNPLEAKKPSVAH
jgi:polyisoprenoid-binding protein YceI